MNYRNLGDTGITVSEIGFGSWGIGGLTKGATSYGATNDLTSTAALVTAFINGITFFDTSNIYGDGHSEELIGNIFERNRNMVVIATKGGLPEHGQPHNLSYKFLRKHLEESLRRLKTDYVDVYQLHSPPMKLVTDSVMDTLATFRNEGKVRAIGFSAKSPDDALAAIDLGFQVIQVNFNLIDQRAIENGLFMKARNRNVGIIARTPFNFGFLTERPPSPPFDPRDHRSTWPKEQIERWTKAHQLFLSLNKGKKRTMTELALQFCLSFKAVSTVIPGILRPEEIVLNTPASERGPLSDEELQAIERIAEENVFFEAPQKEPT